MFQRNLLFAHRQVEPEIAEVALKYFYDPLQSLTLIDVAPSVFAEVHPDTIGTIKTGLFPDSIEARGFLEDYSASRRSFLTTFSKTTLCISCSYFLVKPYLAPAALKFQHHFVEALKIITEILKK